MISRRIEQDVGKLQGAVGSFDPFDTCIDPFFKAFLAAQGSKASSAAGPLLRAT